MTGTFPTPKAFVSSTYEDLKTHRAHVVKVLERAGFFVDPMENWTADSRAPKEFSRARLEGCVLCILLVALRRGHVPEGETRSITQMEYDAAVERGIDVLVYLLREDAPWPRTFDELERDPEIRRWRRELEDTRGVGFFDRDPSSIDLAPALVRWMAEHRPSGLADAVSELEYAEAIEPLFLRRAWDPDVHRYIHGPPEAWHDALRDTRRALVTGVWKDRDGQLLGTLPPIRAAPESLKPLLLAIDRALAYCVADLGEELRSPDNVRPLSPQPPAPLPVTSRQLIHSSWVEALGLDPLQAASETEPYSVETFIRAISARLNDRVFWPNGRPGLTVGNPVPPTESELSQLAARLQEPGRDSRFRARSTAFQASLIRDSALGDEDLIRAIETWEEALRLMEEDEPRWRAPIYRRIADTYGSLASRNPGHVEEAIAWYAKARELFRDLGYENDLRLTEERLEKIQEGGP